MASLKRTHDRITQALRATKNHENYVFESEAAIGYLPPLKAGDKCTGHSPKSLSLEPPSNDPGELRRMMSRINYHCHLFTRVAFDLVNRKPHDFFLRIEDRDGKIKIVSLHSKLMEQYNSLGIFLANRPITTIDRPHYMTFKDPWYSAAAFQFAIACFYGTHPEVWYHSNTTIEESIPNCIAPSIRNSMNRMLHSLYFLRAITYFELHDEYLMFGVNHVISEMNIWNIELVLAYLLSDHHSHWERIPSNTVPTTFEPLGAMTTFIKNAYVEGVTAGSADELIEYVARFLRKNTVNVDELSQPYQACPMLGAHSLPMDGIGLPPLPEVITKHKFDLATLRVAAASPEGWNDELAWNGHILPSLLVSLPYGILKKSLYHSNIGAQETYKFAQRVLGWREQRRIAWLENIKEKEDVYIFWKRPTIIYDLSRTPSEIKLPQRFRWIEVAFFKKIQDPENGNKLIEFFDFKRYRYQWQCVRSDELELVLPYITAADNGRASDLNKRIMISDHIYAARVAITHTEDRPSRTVVISSGSGRSSQHIDTNTEATWQSVMDGARAQPNGPQSSQTQQSTPQQSEPQQSAIQNAHLPTLESRAVPLQNGTGNLQGADQQNVSQHGRTQQSSHQEGGHQHTVPRPIVPRPSGSGPLISQPSIPRPIDSRTATQLAFASRLPDSDSVMPQSTPTRSTAPGSAVPGPAASRPIAPRIAPLAPAAPRRAIPQSSDLAYFQRAEMLRRATQLGPQQQNRFLQIMQQQPRSYQSNMQTRTQQPPTAQPRNMRSRSR